MCPAPPELLAGLGGWRARVRGGGLPTLLAERRRGAGQPRFAIGASMLSIFAVVQLVMYAVMQVPVGVLVDRFGSRLMIALGALVMAGGQVLLALTYDPAGALVARMLVGTGDAMTFVCVLRLIPAWFRASQVPILTQVTGLLGQLGQVASTIPLVAALAGPGWTTAYLGAAAIGVLIAVLVLAAVRDVPPGSPAHVTVGGWRRAADDLLESFAEPGTRLGLWSHFTTQFSGRWCSRCSGASRS